MNSLPDGSAPFDSKNTSSDGCVYSKTHRQMAAFDGQSVHQLVARWLGV